MSTCPLPLSPCFLLSMIPFLWSPHHLLLLFYISSSPLPPLSLFFLSLSSLFIFSSPDIFIFHPLLFRSLNLHLSPNAPHVSFHHLLDSFLFVPPPFVLSSSFIFLSPLPFIFHLSSPLFHPLISSPLLTCILAPSYLLLIPPLLVSSSPQRPRFWSDVQIHHGGCGSREAEQTRLWAELGGRPHQWLLTGNK